MMIRRIGLLTSGGDAPGMNAAIRSVVRYGLHHKLEAIGIYRGYVGLINEDLKSFGIPATNDIVGLLFLPKGQRRQGRLRIRLQR